MTSDIFVILTTYKRLDCALQTVHSFRERVSYGLGRFRWIVTDDGSPESEIQAILRALPTEHTILYRSDRRGTGHNMNWAIEKVKQLGGELLITLEDDWEAEREFRIDNYAILLKEDANVGMVRFGYLSPGAQAEVVSLGGKLYLKLLENGYQYRYTGHPALKHIRFYQEYSMYVEGRTPGKTELHMCGIVNSKPNGPAILVPIHYQTQWGLFGHIGNVSLADTEPGNTT